MTIKGATCNATNGPNGTKSISIAGTGEAYNYPYTCNDGYDNDGDRLIDFNDEDCQLKCPAFNQNLIDPFGALFANWFSRKDGYDACCGDDSYNLNGDFEQ